MLHEKAVLFEITYINQHNKPEWLLKISPLGRMSRLCRFSGPIIYIHPPPTTPGSPAPPPFAPARETEVVY